MTLGQITLIVFALLMETGGIIGFFLKGSKPSLIAGAASGGLLIVAFAVTFFNMPVGLWIGAVVSLLLCVVFCIRLARTRKFMPSGMLLVLSVAGDSARGGRRIRSAAGSVTQPGLAEARP